MTLKGNITFEGRDKNERGKKLLGFTKKKKRKVKAIKLYLVFNDVPNEGEKR